jgi:ubiquinone/menaquinone biosynthesis C-methylase UbiE
MINIEIFNDNAKHYEEWFIENESAYQAELTLIKSLIPEGKEGIEIGAGTGQFAVHCGVKEGIEPADSMAYLARKKGLTIYKGYAEELSFLSKTYDFVLMITVLCFLNDVNKALKEVYSIINPSGFVIIGLLDRESPAGKIYNQKKHKSTFFKYAKFFSTEEVVNILKETGFINIETSQTLFNQACRGIEDFKPGHGEGLFVAIKAQKPA